MRQVLLLNSLPDTRGRFLSQSRPSTFFWWLHSTLWASINLSTHLQGPYNLASGSLSSPTAVPLTELYLAFLNFLKCSSTFPTSGILNILFVSLTHSSNSSQQSREQTQWVSPLTWPTPVTPSDLCLNATSSEKLLQSHLSLGGSPASRSKRPAHCLNISHTLDPWLPIQCLPTCRAGSSMNIGLISF